MRLSYNSKAGRPYYGGVNGPNGAVHDIDIEVRSPSGMAYSEYVSLRRTVGYGRSTVVEFQIYSPDFGALALHMFEVDREAALKAFAQAILITSET